MDAWDASGCVCLLRGSSNSSKVMYSPVSRFLILIYGSVRGNVQSEEVEDHHLDCSQGGASICRRRSSRERVQAWVQYRLWLGSRGRPLLCHWGTPGRKAFLQR